MVFSSFCCLVDEKIKVWLAPLKLLIDFEISSEALKQQFLNLKMQSSRL
jgi:hypothetical protein